LRLLIARELSIISAKYNMFARFSYYEFNKIKGNIFDFFFSEKIQSLIVTSRKVNP